MYFSSKTSILMLFIAFIVLATATKPLYEFHQKGFLRPHPDKAYRGGEDAFFSNNELLIVADGVGSWGDFGVDPAFYARFLCSKGAQLFQQNKTFYRQNLIELIANASNLNENVGSSTMVAITLNGEKLRTCFIGDSGFVIFRLEGDEYKLFFEFKQQQHGFNFPFQLAMKEYYGDDPYLSVCQDFTIQETDIIVAGTDGLFDNVFVTEILNMVNMNFKEDEKLMTIPQTLANLAIKRGADRKFESPFSIHAKEQMLKYLGGKLDDTTVVLAKINKIEEKIEEKKEETVEPVLEETSKTNIKGQSNVEQKKQVDPQETSTYEVMGDNYGNDQVVGQEGDWYGPDGEYYGPDDQYFGENGEYYTQEGDMLGQEGNYIQQNVQNQQLQHEPASQQQQKKDTSINLTKQPEQTSIEQTKKTQQPKQSQQIKQIEPTKQSKEKKQSEQVKQSSQVKPREQIRQTLQVKSIVQAKPAEQIKLKQQVKQSQQVKPSEQKADTSTAQKPHESI